MLVRRAAGGGLPLRLLPSLSPLLRLANHVATGRLLLLLLLPPPPLLRQSYATRGCREHRQGRLGHAADMARAGGAIQTPQYISVHVVYK